MKPYSEWLDYATWAAISIAISSAVVIAIDVFRRPQKMGIMNIVWPITGLYWGPVALWAYFRTGTKTTKQHHEAIRTSKAPAEIERAKEQMKRRAPTRTQIALADTHCGAGCALGDIVAEVLVAAASLEFLGGVLPTRLAIDFIFAWSLGVVFQYFTIVPMRRLSTGKGIVAAMKADTISIIAFQIGMAIWMILTYYVLFPQPHLKPSQGVFWFMMQIAMIVGWATSYPANVWLLHKGFKERMPESPGAAASLDEAA